MNLFILWKRLTELQKEQANTEAIATSNSFSAVELKLAEANLTITQT